MKTVTLPALFLVLLCLQWRAAAEPGPMQLWYNSPAAPIVNEITSHEALPVDNGKIAAMIYGGVGAEVLQFNEDTIWAGSPHDYSHPGAFNYLDNIRNYIWNGQGEAAYNNSDGARNNFMSIPIRQSPYQPAGELWLTFPHSGTLNYRRTLDLETAIASVKYDYGGVSYRRDVFASYPDKVIVIRLTADQPGSFSFSCTFSTRHSGRSISTSGNDLILNANVTLRCTRPTC